MDSTSRVRPARLGAAPPSLVANAKQVGQPRASRAALADVSNRESSQQPGKVRELKRSGPLPPPSNVSIVRRDTSATPVVVPTRPPSRQALPVELHQARNSTSLVAQPVAAEHTSTQDISMTTETGLETESHGHFHATPESSFDEGISASHSSGSLASDDSEALAVLELDVDPTGLVTLPFDLELEAQQRVAEICETYQKTVLVPQALAAQAERRKLVQQGELDPAVAAIDDEIMRMGLDPEEARDASMVAEYAADIFEYMASCERESMPNPNYMDFQDEIQWHMRTTLIDWLLQVHMRYHMLPETLWIAVNLVDRFLSARIVSLAKLQLVGVTAMFIAAKYEEILAPSVEEFVFMTENGYSREEILKGERIVLSTLDFNVSTYCTPYSWVRRISKADDYDIQTRTLCKFLMEATLLHHHFLRARPSLIAAIGMYLAKRMLGGVWDEAFVYYSHFCEEQLIPATGLLLERLIEPGFDSQFVYKKYASKKFLKASIYARNWALRNYQAFLSTHSAHLSYVSSEYSSINKAH
ncbi:B-type cyclin [Malassezia yamatoensis]|uniref:B-type cyclin n=1 Tax=Malassezia yamatoensis TaxID=253288 RepID=A0AAJ5YPR9_9BASI|nr:B-type cyclin [Malassezia yamatoensis]